MSFLGPIQRLRLLSTMCPWGVSEEQQAMRNADMLLQSVPIRWYRRMEVLPKEKIQKKKNSCVIIDKVNGLSSCGEITTFKEASTTRKLEPESPKYSPYIGIDSTINVIDTNEGPALEILSNQYAFVDTDDNVPRYHRTIRNTKANPLNLLSIIEPSLSRGTSITSPSPHGTMKKVILFRDIQTIATGEDTEWEHIGLSRTENSIMIFANYDLEKNSENTATGEQKFTWSNSTPSDEEQSTGKTVNSSSSQYTTRVLACELIPDSTLSLSREEVFRHINTLIDWVKGERESSHDMIKYFDCSTISHSFTNFNTPNKNADNNEVEQSSPTSIMVGLTDSFDIKNRNLSHRDLSNYSNMDMAKTSTAKTSNQSNSKNPFMSWVTASPELRKRENHARFSRFEPILTSNYSPPPPPPPSRIPPELSKVETR